jgi:hypothetical protein
MQIANFDRRGKGELDKDVWNHEWVGRGQNWNTKARTKQVQGVVECQLERQLAAWARGHGRVLVLVVLCCRTFNLGCQTVQVDFTCLVKCRAPCCC